MREGSSLVITSVMKTTQMQQIETLLASLWRLQQQGLFCDTAIIAKGGVEIQVHAAVLAAVSTRLSQALRESLSLSMTSSERSWLHYYRLNMTDYDEQSLHAVVKYIYTADNDDLFRYCKRSDRNLLISVTEICDKFGIELSSITLINEQQSPIHKWNVTADYVAGMIANYTEDGEPERRRNTDDEVQAVHLELVSKPESSDGNTVVSQLILVNNTKELEQILDQTSKNHSEFASHLDLSNSDKKSPRSKVVSAITVNSHSDRLNQQNIMKVKNEVKVNRQSDVKSSGRLAKNNSQTLSTSKSERKKVNTKDAITKYGCHLCERKFSSKKLQTEHVKRHMKAEVQDIIDSQDLNIHMPSSSDHHFRMEATSTDCLENICNIEEPSFSCYLCNSAFNSIEQLQQHKLHQHKAGSSKSLKLSCSQCDSQFFQRSQLLKHEITHTDEWPRKCSECELSFLSADSLINHIDTAHATSHHQPYVCETCGRRFSLSSSRDQHMRTHDRSRRLFKCLTCNKTFRCAAYLRSHEQVHAGGTRPFVCDFCGKGFLGSSNLTTHRRIHTGERPYACRICDKRFLQLCAVREHEKIHAGLKLFVCDVCGKQFMTHAQLYNHSRIHGGVKAFTCDECKKQFYTNGDLVKHARIHADRRPFVCDVCGKGFKYSSNLHGHARIHTGLRPYVCKTCGKGFTYSSHLSRHVKLHVREKSSDASVESDKSVMCLDGVESRQLEQMLTPVYSTGANSIINTSFISPDIVQSEIASNFQIFSTIS